MTKNMFDESVPLEDRLQQLKDHSDIQDSGPYTRSLTQEELDQRRETLADNSIKLSKLNEELKSTKAEYKAKMDPIKDNNEQLCDEIEYRQAEFNGPTFGFADQANGMMNFYDNRGEWIGSRRLKPEEKNNLFTAHKIAQ